MKQLDRLLLFQGNRCFFCDQPIPEGEASVEHLVASSNGGANDDDNCVACCKSLNTAFGNRPYKEKLRAVLSHRGRFICPMRLQARPDTPTAPPAPTSLAKAPSSAVSPDTPTVPPAPTSLAKAPNSAVSPDAAPPKGLAATANSPVVAVPAPKERMAMVLEDLRKRGASRPRTVATLQNTIASLFKKKLSDQQVLTLFNNLIVLGHIVVKEKSISYNLPLVGDAK